MKNGVFKAVADFVLRAITIRHYYELEVLMKDIDKWLDQLRSY